MTEGRKSSPMVVFILGWGRSGSTFLDALLGATPGAASLGEVMYLAHRGLVERRLCGCGEPIPECPIWSGVVGELAAELADLGGAAGLERLRDRVCAPSTVLAQRLARGRPYARPGERERRYARFHQHFYQAASARLGKRVLIDSSKHPAHAAAIACATDLPCRFIHLVRGPCAVAHSLAKQKGMRDGSGRDQIRRTTPRAALSWAVFNHICRRFVAADPRGVSLRYEDLCAGPEASLREVLQGIGGDLEPVSIAVDGRVSLPANHTVSGNPSRFRNGGVRIQVDDAWQRELPPLRQRLVRAVTQVEARHYGYA